MHNKNSKTRRKLLFALTSGIVGASQLPKSWTKPVVNAVLLPAHAQTTDTDAGPTPTPPPALPTAFSGPIDFPGSNADSKNPANKLLSLFVSEAHAGLQPANSGQMCITIDSPGGSNFITSILLANVNGLTTVYEGNGSVSGGPSALNPSSGCTDIFGTPTIEVTNVTATGAEYTIAAGFVTTVSGTLPKGTGCPDTSVCMQSDN